MKVKNALLLGASAFTLTFTSCGEDKAEAAKGIDKTKLSAVDAVTNWKADHNSGQIASLWDSLPASYQSDVEGIVHTVGSKIDQELYNEALSTLTAANKLLISKK